MKVLITGGAGFIGSHLSERHLSYGDSVSIIDNLSTGSIDNLQNIEGHENFKVVIGDVLNEHEVRPLVDECDMIYHLAAAVGVNFIIEEPAYIVNIKYPWNGDYS